MIAVPAAKKAASKNNPKDILCNENHLYGVILVHLALNIVLKTRKYFQAAGYQCKNSKFVCLTYSLTTVSQGQRPNEAANGHHFDTRINSLVGCAFWGSDKPASSVPFIFH